MKKFRNLRKKKKSKKNPEKKKQIRKKNRKSSDLFLNEYNQKLLKRYNKLVIKDLSERKKIYNEVKKTISVIPSRSAENGDIDE